MASQTGPHWRAATRRWCSKVTEICQGLRDAGLPDDWPIMLAANASLPEQQTLIGTLDDMPGRLAATPLPSPCLIVVGSVVTMADATHHAGRVVTQA